MNKCLICGKQTLYNLCGSCEIKLHRFYDKEYINGFRLGDDGYISVSTGLPKHVKFVEYNKDMIIEAFNFIHKMESGSLPKTFIEMSPVDARDLMIWKDEDGTRYKRFPEDIAKDDKYDRFIRIVDSAKFEQVIDYMCRQQDIAMSQDNTLMEGRLLTIEEIVTNFLKDRIDILQGFECKLVDGKFKCKWFKYKS